MIRHLLTALVVVTVLSGCKADPDAGTYASQEEQYHMEHLRSIVHYIKDERTHIAILVCSDGGSVANSSVAVVPWDAVPDSVATIIKK